MVIVRPLLLMVGIGLIGLGGAVAVADQKTTSNQSTVSRALPVMSISCTGGDQDLRDALCKAFYRQISDTVPGYVFRQFPDLSDAPTRATDLRVLVVVQTGSNELKVRLQWRKGPQAQPDEGPELLFERNAMATPQALTDVVKMLLKHTPDFMAQTRP
tara:strand:+ start:1044 stop:1517 length:474 start_codon:yes stop_codon:yes gene_type:complete